MDENPIDKDKVAESPGTLTYAHHVGSSVIKPIDKGRVKGNAVAAMYQQTDKQLAQIKTQIDLLAEQAKSIYSRIEISEKIYEADFGFKPLIGETYYLYEDKGSYIASMISPQEWGKKKPFERFVANITLLSDHTWEIIAS